MNKEVIQSVIRSIMQILGVLLALGVGAPFLPEAVDILQFLSDKMDSIFSASNELIGIGLTIYGFFINKDRFENRAVGKKLKETDSKNYVKTKALITN